MFPKSANSFGKPKIGEDDPCPMQFGNDRSWRREADIRRTVNAPAGTTIRKRPILPPTSSYASNDKRSAGINSLDNLRIKSLGPSIIRWRMKDT